jgi:integrase/recombinase XerD
MPPHQELEAFIDEYLTAAGICDGGRGSLFHTARGKTGALAGEPMHRIDAYRMIRRRMAEARFKVKI